MFLYVGAIRKDPTFASKFIKKYWFLLSREKRGKPEIIQIAYTRWFWLIFKISIIKLYKAS